MLLVNYLSLWKRKFPFYGINYVIRALRVFKSRPHCLDLFAVCSAQTRHSSVSSDTRRMETKCVSMLLEDMYLARKRNIDVLINFQLLSRKMFRSPRIFNRKWTYEGVLKSHVSFDDNILSIVVAICTTLVAICRTVVRNCYFLKGHLYQDLA